MYTVGLLDITYMKERRMTTLLGPKGQTGKQAYIITTRSMIKKQMIVVGVQAYPPPPASQAKL